MMDPNHTSLIMNSLSLMLPIPTGIDPVIAVPGNIRAVLFDIYGTLLISGTGDIGVASRHLNSLETRNVLKGIEGSLIRTYLTREIKKRHLELRDSGVEYPEVEIRDIWRAVLAILISEGLLDDESEIDSVETLSLQYELAMNPVWPMPGFPEIVREIRDAGYRVGIISNAQFYTPMIIEAVTGMSLKQIGFEAELCAWSYRLSMAKPSPEVFEVPLKNLAAAGIPPDEILYVGNDMLNDVTAASEAGCRTALFAGDRRSLRLRKGELRAGIEPDMIITDLSQLDILISGGLSHG